MDDTYERGMAVRREVLGAEHVERASRDASALDADFQRWITETVWGSVWTRPGLDHRTRSLVTIAILAALGRDELDLHLRAAANTGATPEEITEVMFHVGVYAGVPAGHAGMHRLKAIAGGDGDE
jgi:4-carboxymuconolactone decarboxylase